MPRSEFPMPGLKRRANKGGGERLLWVARADLVKAGYKPKSIRLHYAENELALISAACQRYQAEMLQWASAMGQDTRFDGTLGSLAKAYQTDPASPYKRIKWTTRRTYDNYLGIVERAFGKRAIGSLKLSDFRRWYDEARKPKTPGGPEQIRKAHGIVSMLRRLVSYGVAAEIDGAARLHAILANTKFEQPGRRRHKLELVHVEAIIVEALKRERLSIALGTAIQFETAMRQRDVIGEWAPIVDGAPAGGIVLGRRRWCNGLLWSDIAVDLELRKVTTKTGAVAAHDLKLCPIVMAVLDLVPAEQRVGPVIIDEKAGRPYAEWMYAREWRAIARLAGVPAEIWNADARAGGISEADDAGADIDFIRSAATHSQISTTVRYIRSTIGKSRQVAKMRVAHRQSRNEG